MEKDRYMVIYSSRDGKLSCVFVWKSNDRLAPPIEKRWDVLRENYRDAPSLFRKVIEHFPDDSPMLMDPLVQIEMKKWHTGRVVLLGDAAHCMTLLSGQGASSAFADASYLSKALIDGEPEGAFNVLAQTMHPAISEMQAATRKAARWYVPRTRARQMIRDTGMKMLPVRYFKRYFKEKYMKI